jgi:hypothetical protein
MRRPNGERLRRAIRFLRRQPVLSDGQGRSALRLEALSQLPMEGAAAYPGDIAIDRFTGERVPEGTPSRLDLDQQTTFEQRVQPIRAAGQIRYQRQVELTASHCGEVEQP